MAETLLDGALQFWENTWHVKPDPRSIDWPLVRSPLPMIVWLVVYLLAVFFGPKLMKNRQPFELRGLMAGYNLLMVVWSGYMMTELHLVTYHLDNRYCTGIDYSDDPKAVRLASVIWLTYISKGIEFSDTIIFILRKKTNQVTFLHVYHHAVVLVVGYMAARWYTGGISWFWPCFNSFIHFLMYSYYFVSGLGPQFQKYLWWKKYLTLMQLIQFLAGLLIIIYSFWAECDHAAEWKVIMFLYLGSLFVLFSMFYQRSYQKSPKAEKGKQN
eukprot:scpid78516/ scgid1871/ Elongation of very long chain fatty acids protein 4; 3-keto acyl-CoA synthase Elovl4; ELOVL fatty acid elongase 4